MFGLFNKKALLEESETLWLFDTFKWALENFDSEFFYKETILVLPTNHFFPGKAGSEYEMADLICNQVKRYAGISHWPTQITDQNSCELSSTPLLGIQGSLRHVEEEIVKGNTTTDDYLLMPYNPQQVNNPEGMIATFSHVIAHYMASVANQSPPGGDQFLPQATEVLAIYLGFGLMFANSAFTFKGGCGSCYNPNAIRSSYLTEYESTYALAIFSVIKEIPNIEISRHLKGHLKSFYNRATNEIRSKIDNTPSFFQIDNYMSA